MSSKGRYVLRRMTVEKPDNGGRNRATAKDLPFVNALPVAPVHDLVIPSSAVRDG